MVKSNVPLYSEAIAYCFADDLANIKPSQAGSIQPSLKAPNEQTIDNVPESIFFHPDLEQDVIKILIGAKSTRLKDCHGIGSSIVRSLKFGSAHPSSTELFQRDIHLKNSNLAREQP